MNKTLAIIGVDGTGKSSVIKALENEYGDKCIITYMGYRSFEDPKIEELQNIPSSSIITKIVKYIYVVFLTYKCYLNRYKLSVKTGRYVIFDRYVHEIYINAHGVMKLVYTLLYKYLYPNPSKIVYLYCPVDESLKRKDDITDIMLFKNMKERFDKKFLHNKKCLCLDSSVYSTQELAEQIKKIIVIDG